MSISKFGREINLFGEQISEANMIGLETPKKIDVIEHDVVSSKHQRIVFLDSLRFIAAAAVVFQHLMDGEGVWAQKLVGTLSPGVFGVVLFFIISGFVIPMAASKKFRIDTFILRRIFRIYPLVIAVFILLFVISKIDGFPSFQYIKDATYQDWYINILLIQDYVGVKSLWGVTWTLSLEIAWYSLFAISLILFGDRYDDWLALVAPVVLMVLAILSIYIGHRLPLGRMDMIYAAILGCRFYRYHTGLLGERQMWSELLIFIVVVTIGNIISFGYFKHANITVNQSVYPWLAASLLFSAVAMIKNIRNSRLIKNRIIGWLGAISFSIYLLHPFAVYIANDLFPAEAALATSMILTLCFAIIGYYSIEIPGQKLGRWIERSFFH